MRSLIEISIPEKDKIISPISDHRDIKAKMSSTKIMNESTGERMKPLDGDLRVIPT